MQAEGDERKVGFYIRVSTERQARVQEGSLKNQRQILKAELERRNQQASGWGVFVEAYVDEGLSGKNTNRPAFQRMMRDAEIGRIDTVMFTDLSRLSRSLKDFLNIFEFAQKHQCDLVCLKTEIDTTSPYKSLITKILMIFAEFEREMTSRRTSANAYERSKRGLANGGVAPLGYRRDKKRKGYLIGDPTESQIVQEIFSTYLKEQSIKRTAEQIRQNHPKRINGNLTRSKVHSILTNKAYIGVREIYKRDPTNRQEVPAVWEPLIDHKTFEQVQVALQKNRDQYNRHQDRARFSYLFSGLIRCGKCGQRLQGKSAWSSSNNHRYHYYSHRHGCSKDGITRIDAALIHRLVLGWLQDIAADGERFQRLRTEGVKRTKRRIVELQKTLTHIDRDVVSLVEQIETRIEELTRTANTTVRRSIETSITKLEQQKEESLQGRLYVEKEIGELQALTTDPGLFAHYQRAIPKVLALIESKHNDAAKRALAGLVASLTITAEGIKVALSGNVNRKAPGSTLLVSAPPDRQHANGRIRRIELIEGRIPLPGRFLLSDPKRLARLHEKAGLSAHQIAERIGVSHSSVLAALRKLGVVCEAPTNGHAVRGQVPFGWDVRDGRLVKNAEEQQVIRLIRQMHRNGESLNGIARELNRQLVPTKNAGLWQANTVRKILKRTQLAVAQNVK